VDEGRYSLQDGGATVREAADIEGLGDLVLEAVRAMIAARWGADFDNDSSRLEAIVDFESFDFIPYLTKVE